ncbi:MAG: M23 family metallopeptidase [Clostridia bacterium]|nr:M23 family metallopeptidase [Clostridia bacterium]
MMKLKKKLIWIKLSLPILIFFIIILFGVSLFPRMDEVDVALEIDVPFMVIRAVEDEFDDSFPYYLAMAAENLSFDWDDFLEDAYIEELKDYNMRMLNDLYSYDEEYRNLVDVYQQAYGDIECYVIPRITYEYKSKKRTEVRLKTPSHTVYNDFGAERNYKEVTKHKGNDTIADEGVPLVSMTDGVLERIGWNEHGGWRIGIRAPSGAYFYYAHMEEYCDEIEEGDLSQGDRIKAGQLIGYVGDTGYGPEGTEGQFVNHLHLQIGVKMKGFDGDFWVNPYNAMRFKEDEKVILDFYDDEERPDIITRKEFKKWYEDDD